MTLQYKFLIDSVDITSFVLEGTKIERSRMKTGGDGADIILSLGVITSLYPEAGMEIIVSRGVLTSTEIYEFKGTITSVVFGEDDIGLICKDKLSELDNKLIKKSYDINIDPQAGKISEIFKDLVETYGGMTASVVDSGTDIIIRKFICNNDKILERLEVLANILDWYFYYDYDLNVVRFEPKGYESFSTTLKVGTNVYNLLEWNEDIERMVNKVIVEGAYEFDTRSNSFTGDASEDTFTLSFTPETTEVTIAGVLKVRGYTDSSGTFDYIVDRELKTIEFVTPPGMGAAIVVKYSTKIPAPVQGIASDSISKYGVVHEEVYRFNDIQNVTDAENRLTAILNLMKYGDINAEILTTEYTVNVGMSVTVEDPNRPSMNGNYIVRKKIINYPEQFDAITIGNLQFNIQEFFLGINERLNALEKGDLNYDEILRQLFNLDRIATYERRYTILQKTDLTLYDGIILDDVTRGLDDVSYGVDGSGDVTTNSRITHYQNTYKEFLYDTDFKDATSTGDWNTTTKVITLTDGEYILSDTITRGTTFSYFTASLGSVTGTYALEVSGDGKSNWQTATLNVRTPFAVADITGVYYKITNTGVGGSWGVWDSWGVAVADVVIQNTYYADGSYNLPAVKIIVEE